MKGVIFDLDGTLLDTLADIADAMNRALELHGLPVWRTEEYRLLVGNGARVLAERAVRSRADLVEEVLRDYQAWYSTHSLVRTHVYHGVTEALDALQRRGVPMAVLSNKPEEDTRRVVRHFFPQIRFAAVCGVRPGTPAKPDPAGALAVAGQLRKAPADCCVVGDSDVDMDLAHNAGMTALGALWGYRGEEELREHSAFWLLRQPRELLLLPELMDGE